MSGTLGVSQDQTLITVEEPMITAPIGFNRERCGAVTAEDVMPTIQAAAGESGNNQPMVVYGISSYDSNAMKSSNPHSGIYEADTARTLDLNGGSPACNQGGMAVVQGADVWTGSLTGDKAATLTSACGSTNATGPKVIIGADMYNNALTGDVAATLNAHSGANATSSGPSVICIEGNGSRESHKGDGYKESDTMYTLNTVEQHAVAYRKTAHPMNAEQGQGWEEATVNDTLNINDNSEARTPTVVVEYTRHKHQRRGANKQ